MWKYKSEQRRDEHDLGHIFSSHRQANASNLDNICARDET